MAQQENHPKITTMTPQSSMSGRRSSVLDQIEKRDGRVVPFERRRIEEAVEKACAALGESDVSFIAPMVDDLCVHLEKKSWGIRY